MNGLSVNLNEFERATGNAHIPQLVPESTSSAEEVNAEVVDGCLAFGKLQFHGATLTDPHGHLHLAEGKY